MINCLPTGGQPQLLPAGATFSLWAWLCQDRPVAGRRGRDRCGPPMETAVQRSDRPTEHDTHAPAGLNQKTTPDIPESAGMLIVGPSLPLGMKSPPGENYRTDRAWVTTWLMPYTWPFKRRNATRSVGCRRGRVPRRVPVRVAAVNVVRAPDIGNRFTPVISG